MVGEKGEAHLVEKEKGHDSAGKRFLWATLASLVFSLCLLGGPVGQRL